MQIKEAANCFPLVKWSWVQGIGQRLQRHHLAQKPVLWNLLIQRHPRRLHLCQQSRRHWFGSQSSESKQLPHEAHGALSPLHPRPSFSTSHLNLVFWHAQQHHRLPHQTCRLVKNCARSKSNQRSLKPLCFKAGSSKHASLSEWQCDPYYEPWCHNEKHTWVIPTWSPGQADAIKLTYLPLPYRL